MALASLLSVTLALPAVACTAGGDPDCAQRTDTQLHAELGARVQQALRQTEGRDLRFEVIEVSDWRLGRDAAEFVLWGLLHDDTAPARMLRVESWIDRRSLQLGALDLQLFDEFQALELPFQR